MQLAARCLAPCVLTLSATAQLDDGTFSIALGPDVTQVQSAALSGFGPHESLISMSSDGTFRVSYSDAGAVVTATLPPLVAAAHADFACGAVDNDNRTDVVVARGDADGNGIVFAAMLGTAGPMFSSGPSVHIPAMPGEQVQSVALADIDADGDQDVIGVASDGVGNVRLLTVRSAGGAWSLASTHAFAVGTPTGLATGDIDGDGDADCAFVTSAGFLITMRTDGTGSWTSHTLMVGVGTELPRDVGIEDFDADGAAEIVVVNGPDHVTTSSSSAAAMDIVKSDASSSWLHRRIPGGNFVARGGLSIGDVDLDGDPDVVLASDMVGPTGCILRAHMAVITNDGETIEILDSWRAEPIGPLESIDTAIADFYGLGLPSVALLTDVGELVYHQHSPPVFTRGDANGDLVVNIADVIFCLEALFQDGPQPLCVDAADVNDDGMFDVADPTYLLASLFYGGPQPPEPFAAPGYDRSEDENDDAWNFDLGCTDG